MAVNRKSTKSRILGLDSSRRRLNSSKTINEITYYSLADVESVVAAVLSEVSSDLNPLPIKKTLVACRLMLDKFAQYIMNGDIR